MGGDHSCTFCAGTGKLKCAECAHSYMYGIFRHPKTCDDCGGTKYKNNVHIDCALCKTKGYIDTGGGSGTDEEDSGSNEIQREEDGEDGDGSIGSGGDIDTIRCNKCDGKDESCLFCAGTGARKVKRSQKKKLLRSNPNRKICAKCKGKGWTIGRVICPKCKGNRLFDYIVCQNCKGSTRVDCLACDATGSTFLKGLRDRFSCFRCCWEKKSDEEDETRNLID